MKLVLILKASLKGAWVWFFNRLSDQQVENLSNRLLSYYHRSQEAVRMRQARAKGLIEPAILDNGGQALTRSILDKRAVWHSLQISDCSIPGMLTESEKKYYRYITGCYQGIGEVVELGPWLGLSTHHILNGLLLNDSFESKKIHVYDDFVWRGSWMNKWLDATEILPLEDYSSFEPLFREQLATQIDHLEIRRAKIANYDGNESLDQIYWDHGAIEIIIVDCGRLLSVNEAWWDIFSPHFIKDKTLIIMQDWQNHKCVPEVYWENTKIFTDSKEDQLDLIHEVANAGIATFIYRGQ